MIKPQDAANIGQLAHLVGLMPYLEHEIREMQTHVINVTMQDLSKGTLTPEIALYRWQELAIGQALMKRFQRRVRIGQTTGERSAGQMRLNEDTAVNG